MSDNKLPFLFYSDPDGVLTTPGLDFALRAVVSLAQEYGCEGNVWQSYLAYQLMVQENPFSLACERCDIAEDVTVKALAQRDLEIFYKLFAHHFNREAPHELLLDYHASQRAKRAGGHNVARLLREFRDRLASARSLAEFVAEVTRFYRCYGVGAFGVNRAFRLGPGSTAATAEFLPISNIDPVRLDDLVGYESQKRELTANTEAFLAGRPANNVLLYGDAGTGKSSSVKALINEYYDSGLRMIEVHKHQFQALAAVIAQIKNRAYRFIVFIDDLSFEESELEYKFLKSAIEGGLETRPSNVLIYATSNRRHLVKETWRDRADMEREGDIHHSDTMEEKLSLSERFGVTIRYGNPTPQEYRQIIESLAARQGLRLTEAQLNQEAGAWEIRHGGISGRTAQQYVDHLAGQADNGN